MCGKNRQLEYGIKCLKFCMTFTIIKKLNNPILLPLNILFKYRARMTNSVDPLKTGQNIHPYIQSYNT